MALGRQRAVQKELLIGWHEVPRAPGHVFYDRLNAVLGAADFDREVEALCQPHYAAKAGRPSIPPGRYFRMLFVGYFEGLAGAGTQRAMLNGGSHRGAPRIGPGFRLRSARRRASLGHEPLVSVR